MHAVYEIHDTLVLISFIRHMWHVSRVKGAKVGQLFFLQREMTPTFLLSKNSIIIVVSIIKLHLSMTDDLPYFIS